MRVRADFDQRAFVRPEEHRWVRSPQPGVERVLIDRIGEERARATSLVRYAPDSVFPSHAHPGGEEILVLAGVFEDGDEAFPAGWYVRNPPGSSHRPASSAGALLFVKLRQMADTERTAVRVDTRRPDAWRSLEGGATCELFRGDAEHVELRRVDAGGRLDVDAAGGAEGLVVDGRLSGPLGGEDGALDAGAWFRLPPGDAVAFTAGAQGATVYLKRGHLAAPVGIGG